MPRIRKKTTNRATTNDRKKVQHKVRESRKKKAKAAKKDPQWKSKHKKDPGIPNDFPYKDQVLAEVAEQRRLAIEEKERKKTSKRQKRTKPDAEDDQNVEANSRAGSPSDFDGVASIHAQRLTNAKATARVEVTEVAKEEEESDEVPILVNRDLPHLRAVLDSADAVIEVLDARDPLTFRSSSLEDSVKDKPRMLLLNKIDMCPVESVKAWAAVLRKECTTFIVRSASSFLPIPPPVPNAKGKSKAVPVNDAWGTEAVLECIGEWASERGKTDGTFTVAVVGFTNTGKSSFVNSLMKSRSAPIYSLASSSRGPTTTLYPQEVSMKVSGHTVKIIDTPGLCWVRDETNRNADRARDILMRNKGRIDRLKDPEFPIDTIVSRANTEDLMLLFRLPAFSEGDTASFLSGVARAQQMIKKKGALDIVGAARIVLRHWSTGKIHWYTSPPQVPEADANVNPLYENDTSLFKQLSTRKDMRKAGGLVKLAAGQVDPRNPTLEDPYVDATEGIDAADTTLSEGEESGAEESAPDEEEKEEASDEEDVVIEVDEPVVPLSGRQKRKREVEKALPSKKITTASEETTKKPPKSILKKPASNIKKAKQVAPAKTGTGGDDSYDFTQFF